MNAGTFRLVPELLDRPGCDDPVLSPGESVYSSGVVSSSSARIVPTGAFAAQSHNSSSDFWIGGSGASCHMTNDASKMYCVRSPPSDQRGVVTSDGTRPRVEYIGNIDVLFLGISKKQITLIDVSYVPDFKFIFFRSTRHNRHML